MHDADHPRRFRHRHGRALARTAVTARPPAAGPLDGDAPAPALARNVTLLGVTAAFASFWLLAWSPVVPLLLGRAGASSGVIAATFAAVNLATALPQYMGGRLADRIGVRRVIGGCGIGLGVAWTGMALWSGSWPGLALFFIAGNALFGLQGTAFVTVVSDSVPVAARARAFSRFQLWSAVSLVAGPLVGGLVFLPHLKPTAYLGATALAYFAVGAIRLVGLRDPKRLLPARRPPVTPARLLHAAAGGLERRELLVLTTGVTLAFALTVNGPFLALATHRMDHVPTHVVDLLFGIGPVGAIAASALGPGLRAGRSALTVGLGALAAATAALALPLGAVGLVAAYLLAFAGYQLATVAFSTRRVALAGGDDAGEVLGASAAFAGLCAFAALLVAGALGSRLPLAAGGAIAVATAIWQGWGRPIVRVGQALREVAAGRGARA